MKRSNQILQLTLTALLVAVGIMIPMTFPKVVVPPASFTVASHVAIFLAMFLSPTSAALVAAGTTVGFFAIGMDISIVLRAGSHLLFALVGALLIRKFPQLLEDPKRITAFAIGVSLLHGLGEIAVTIPLFLNGSLSPAVYESGFFSFIIGLVGVGTVAHSLIDFAIAYAVWRVLKNTSVVKKARQRA